MKVEELERVVNKMADKIVHLEGKIKEMESKEREVIKIKEAAKSIEDPRKVPNKKDNPIKPKEKKSQPKDPKHKDSVFKFGAAARNIVSDKNKPIEKELLAKYFKCDLCDYKCDKHSVLNKHVNSKHTEQKCKVCDKDFTTSMKLVKHVTREHQDQEESWNNQLQSTPKEDKEGKQGSFKFSESMLNEFL